MRKKVQVTGHYKNVRTRDGIKRVWVKPYSRYGNGSNIVQSSRIKKELNENTMVKDFPENIAEAVKEISKGEYEHSIGIDFERLMEQPQRMVIIQGGKSETIKLEDFEMFGHTHPDWEEPIPSSADLESMYYLSPEFLVAGKTGKMIFMNIEDDEIHDKWIDKKLDPGDHPIPYKDYKDLIKSSKYSGKLTPGDYENLNTTKAGRELFFDYTGVRLYPYKGKVVKIEMLDDPVVEKPYLDVPKEYLKEYHKGK